MKRSIRCTAVSRQSGVIGVGTYDALTPAGQLIEGDFE
jgi:hypothetical protein